MFEVFFAFVDGYLVTYEYPVSNTCFTSVHQCVKRRKNAKTS